MIALLQRVQAARVEVDEQVIGQIGRGLMVLVCAERNDTAADALALADRLVRYRVFSDAQGRMNRSLLDLEQAIAQPSDSTAEIEPGVASDASVASVTAGMADRTGDAAANATERASSGAPEPWCAAAGLLLVPQFTLAADTSSGLRPGFSAAAPPALATERFDDFVAAARTRVRGVQTGRFGADMQVSLTNDGPVTFWLQWPKSTSAR